MKTQPAAQGRFEFFFPERDTLVLVESSGCSLVVRATHDNLSEERKLSFLHELASEGFIPDEYRYYSIERLRSVSGLQWLIGATWVTHSPALLARSRRFMTRLLAGALLSWVLIIGLLFWTHAR